MKSFKLFSIAAICMVMTTVATAQTKTESFQVSGNCGMCKSKIEKAAKDAGAQTAEWNEDSKMLTVTFKSSSTNTARIQKKIAAVGYDNAGAKASDESYKKLHGCCQYDRSESSSDQHEAKADCCKDGKCTKDGHDGKDCCKKSQE